MKKSVLVTLADKNYINAAKQLFSSAYFNAGWQGDYLLLSQDLLQEEIIWFQEKGIIVKSCEKLFNQPFGINNTKLPVMLSKFYLFTEYFKQWEHVIFIDADCIIQKPLLQLTAKKGFYAHKAKSSIGGLFKKEPNNPLWKELCQNYNLNRKFFSSSVMSFSTDVIKPDTFSTLVALFNRYHEIQNHGDEPALNLYFGPQKKNLSLLFNYNAMRSLVRVTRQANPENIPAFILHFPGSSKPWNSDSPFLKVWQRNFARADKINISRVSQIHQYFGLLEIIDLNMFRLLSSTEAQIDWAIGQCGFFLKKNFPEIYTIIRKIVR